MSKQNPIYLKLTTLPEELDEERKDTKLSPFKLCFAVFKDNLSQLFLASLLLIICLVPAMVVFLVALPAEMETISSGYNFMGEIGIGYPGAVSSYVDAQLAFYDSLQLIMFMLVPCVWILTPGVAGFNYVARKFLRGDKIEKSKDVLKCVFIGVKRYWLNTLLTLVLFSLLALGLGSAVLYLLADIVAGTADALSWIVVVLSALVCLPMMLLPVTMLPMTVSYKFNFVDLLKNSAILTLKLWMLIIPLAVVSIVPLVLILMVQSLAVMLGVLWIMVGVSLTLTGWCTITKYACDLYINTIYELSAKPVTTAPKQEALSKKKQPQKNTYVNPKKQGKDKK